MLAQLLRPHADEVLHGLQLHADQRVHGVHIVAHAAQATRAAGAPHLEAAQHCPQCTVLRYPFSTTLVLTSHTMGGGCNRSGGGGQGDQHKGNACSHQVESCGLLG